MPNPPMAEPEGEAAVVVIADFGLGIADWGTGIQRRSTLMDYDFL
jgi:hypothetical protein